MGRSASRRAARNFRKDPLANSCYTLSVLSLTAGVLGLFAVFGGADCLVLRSVRCLPESF